MHVLFVLICIHFVNLKCGMFEMHVIVATDLIGLCYDSALPSVVSCQFLTPYANWFDENVYPRDHAQRDYNVPSGSHSKILLLTLPFGLNKQMID